MGRPDLALTLLTPDGQLPAGTVDRVVEWVHSSDLLDPTPFLSAGQMLLTTGTQFASDTTEDAAYREYAHRLAAHGLVGLGFGTEVIRDGTPEPLVAACLAEGLPLVEVPYATPFIAVARTAGDLIAEDRYARNIWALSAQRAISLAALRPDGLSATLSELSRQLNHWVALFDASGTLTRVFPRDAFAGASAASFPTVAAEATSLLRRGQRSSVTIPIGEDTLTLQTLGRRDQLRGVLALGGASQLDQAGQGVVTSVIALAGLALEQNNALDRARRHLRAGLWHSLLNGDTDLVASISAEMWGPLPGGLVRIAVIDAPPERLDTITEFLEIRAEDQPGRLFFAHHNGRVSLCLDRTGEPVLHELVASFGVHIGLSDPSDYGTLPSALSQALRALERANEGPPAVVEFDLISRQGVLAFLARTDARDVGRATLTPITRFDAAHGTDLLGTMRVWLEHNAEYAAAAAALGIHRHTMRSHMRQAEQLLGRDLSSFPARADIWAALLAAGPQPSEV
nr:PucR family transcriptional regulator [Cryobacterium roopkundense]